MARYVSKPTIVEAEQFVINGPLPFNDRGPVVCCDVDSWYVITIHGDKARLEDGDWVIMEPGSEYQAYPCKHEIFVQRYEPCLEAADVRFEPAAMVNVCGQDPEGVLQLSTADTADAFAELERQGRQRGNYLTGLQQ